jgi:hypothetical protein
MQIDSVLVAFGLAFFWVIFRIIEYFINKKKTVKWDKDHKKKLYEMHDIIVMRAKKHDEFLSNLSSILEKLDIIEDKLKHLDDMHCVYDENLVPRWYLPTDMIKMVRQIHSNLEVTCKEMEAGFGDIEDSQSALGERVIDLITSQRIMVERLGDLINKLNRISSN